MNPSTIEVLLAAETVGDLTKSERQKLSAFEASNPSLVRETRQTFQHLCTTLRTHLKREAQNSLSPSRQAAIIQATRRKKSPPVEVLFVLPSQESAATPPLRKRKQASIQSKQPNRQKVAVLECALRQPKSLNRALRMLLGDERKVSTLLNDSTTAYHQLNSSGCVTWANRRQLLLWNVGSERQVHGRPLWELVRTGDEISVRNYVTQMLAGNRSEPLYCTFRRDEGETRPVAIRGVLIKAVSEDDSRGILSSVEDLSVYDRLETTAPHHDDLYLDAIATTPVPSFRKDTQHRYIWANRAFCREVGVPLESILGKNDYDFFPPIDAAKYQQDDAWVMRTALHLETVERHLPPGNRLQYVQCLKTPIKNEFGEVTGVDCKYWSISSKERAIHLLREAKEHAEDRYRCAFNDAPIGIYQVSKEGRIVRANKACARILGFQSVRDMLLALRNSDASLYQNPSERDALRRKVCRRPWEIRNFPCTLVRHESGGDLVAIRTLQSMRAVRDNGRISYIESYLQEIPTSRRVKGAIVDFDI